MLRDNTRPPYNPIHCPSKAGNQCPPKEPVSPQGKREIPYFLPRLLRTRPGDVTDCSCPCVLQSYRSQCLAMLKTRLRASELAPSRCFISSNARWKKCTTTTLRSVRPAVREGQVQLVLLPTGLAEEVRAVPGGRCGAGGSGQPSLCSPGTPAGAPAPLNAPLRECEPS